MNTSKNESSQIKLPPPPSPPPLPPDDEKLETRNMLALLLKSPHVVAGAISRDETTAGTGVVFLVYALLFHGIFGFAVGLFSGWQVGVMATVKTAMIAFCSLALCLPSLYVFSSVGGTALSMKQTFVLGTSCLALIGLLLIGLAPVAWLFAVSTASLSFIVILTFIIWMISVGFAAKFIGKLKTYELFQRSAGIGFWLIVFVVVSLQMTTCLRPLLTKPDPDRGWWTTEKKFFLSHFSSCFEAQKQPSRK